MGVQLALPRDGLPGVCHGDRPGSVMSSPMVGTPLKVPPPPEFMNVALKKFKIELSVTELELTLSELLKPLCGHIPSFNFYEQALKLYSTHSIGFYDALIVQAAIDLGCTTLYSEDFQEGQKFGTVVIKNPFK